jgi:hypothetical protein
MAEVLRLSTAKLVDPRQYGCVMLVDVYRTSHEMPCLVLACKGAEIAGRELSK